MCSNWCWGYFANDYKTIQNMVTEMDTQSVIYKKQRFYIFKKHNYKTRPNTGKNITSLHDPCFFFSLLFHYRTKKYKLCNEITIPCTEPRIPADEPFPLSRLE